MRRAAHKENALPARRIDFAHLKVARQGGVLIHPALAAHHDRRRDRGPLRGAVALREGEESLIPRKPCVAVPQSRERVLSPLLESQHFQLLLREHPGQGAREGNKSAPQGQPCSHWLAAIVKEGIQPLRLPAPGVRRQNPGAMVTHGVGFTGQVDDLKPPPFQMKPCPLRLGRRFWRRRHTQITQGEKATDEKTRAPAEPIKRCC